jgi:hypothetical protein
MRRRINGIKKNEDRDLEGDGKLFHIMLKLKLKEGSF